MSSKIGRIIEGHLSELTGENEELFSVRYKICDACPKKEVSLIGEICGECGCRLQAKLRVEKEFCPLELW